MSSPAAPERVVDRVERLLAAHGLRALAAQAFAEGATAGQVRRRLREQGCELRRDDLEIWRRAALPETVPDRWHDAPRYRRRAARLAAPPPPPSPPEPAFDPQRLKQALNFAARKDEYLQVIREASAALLHPPSLWTPPPRRSRRPEHQWVLLLSDVQAGQRTTLRETGGLFEQNSEIVAWQMRQLFLLLAELAEIHQAVKQITHLHIVLNGDIVEGDSLRKGQIAKIDQLVTEQTMFMFTQLEEFTLSLLQVFPKVVLWVCPGNHDRGSERPDAAGLSDVGGAIDTYAWLLGQMLARAFRDQTRIDVHVADAFVQAARIAGRRCVWEHGASIRFGAAYSGIPLQGILQTAQRYDRLFGGIDVLLLGHFHQAMVIPLWGGRAMAVVNGAFPPSSDFILKRSKTISRPQQWLLDLHARLGIVDYLPLYIEHEQHRRAAAFWERDEQFYAY